MSFAGRVVRIGESSDPRDKLTEIERSGNPSAVASWMIDFMTKTTRSIPLGPPRASSIYSDCMRKRVIGHFYQVTVPEYESLADKMVFGIGNAIHYWAQNSAELFGSRRRGWWTCLACGFTYFGRPAVRRCKCGARPEAFIYKEHALAVTQPFQVTGHTDMFFETESGLFRTAELKSISGELFEKLKAPYVEHEWQIQTYMWSADKDPLLPIIIDPDIGYVIYISKKVSNGVFPIKAFPIIRNDRIIKAITDKLQLYTDGLVDFPKHVSPCASACKKGGYMNNTCPVKNQCEGIK